MSTDRRPPTVDAHHHFWWDPTPADYPWMTDELAPIRRSFGPDDLRPHLQTAGIDRTILVQTRSSLDETRRFLHIAEDTDFIAGVVGWVDLTAGDVPATLADLRAAPGGRYLVGIRHQVHDEDDPDWLLRPDVIRGLHAVAAADLSYDLLVRTRELPAALAIARQLPDLGLVTDHIAKPPVATGEINDWAHAMAPFSDLPNVSCKLSGMVTEADWRRWTPDDLLPYVQRVIGWFGEDRLLFGSDWPVCLLAASYADVLAACRHTIANLTSSANTKIMGENAIRVYRLGQTYPPAQ
jgi:L-fuconolactonase